MRFAHRSDPVSFGWYPSARKRWSPFALSPYQSTMRTLSWRGSCVGQRRIRGAFPTPRDAYIHENDLVDIARGVDELIDTGRVRAGVRAERDDKDVGRVGWHVPALKRRDPVGEVTANFGIDHDSVDKAGEMLRSAHHDGVAYRDHRRGFVEWHRRLSWRAPGDDHNRDERDGGGEAPDHAQY